MTLTTSARRTRLARLVPVALSVAAAIVLGTAGLGTLGLWLFLAVVVVVATALAVGMIWLADRVLSDSVGQENNSALSPFVICVALVFDAVLGFTVVVASSSSPPLDACHQRGVHFDDAVRQTAALDAPEQTELRNLLRTYTIAV